MSKDKLPALRNGNTDVVRLSEGAARAKQVRDPITGLFRAIGDRAEERAIKGNTAVTRATIENIQAHDEAIRTMMEMYDTIDDYDARMELAPQYYDDAKERHSDKLAANAHSRELAKKSRKQEQLDADRGVFNANQGLGKLQNVRTLKEERWYANAYSKRTAATIRADEYRAAEDSGPIIDVTPEPAAPPWAALEQKETELVEQLNQAIADGRWDDVRNINADLEAVRRAIGLMKKTPG